LRWQGHVVRMKDDRSPKIVLFGRLGLNGKRVIPVRGGRTS